MSPGSGNGLAPAFAPDLFEQLISTLTNTYEVVVCNTNGRRMLDKKEQGTPSRTKAVLLLVSPLDVPGDLLPVIQVALAEKNNQLGTASIDSF